ncbi:MarR family winged helix-turn-helix transcriptional regulator [Bradyrhizobium sp. CCBAU 51753]|uniref:MarR family winged helix-turn-helix transcriptional regulator n=1 Tax=Bradyrhizobium sp. CCBAU 51753 TaxID=1325100 RepID=UPI00188B9E2E|nr:MarR family winged helix-turn-helix transcriptional regulator [Bradyrhizobium sp. CCBAU 51753]QOZ28644.1 MarR family transcriptional regulator [Bradyrhizobium sp. CCBAU 51753]
MARMDTTRCNLTAFRKATRRVSQLYDEILAPSGLRGTQRAILVHVARSQSSTIGELAAALVLDRTALTHNLKPLQRDGLVTVAADKDDRRSKRVRLTKRGESKLAESQDAWRQAQDRFEAAFGARQAAELRQTLELVAALEFGELPPAAPAG